MNIQPAEKASNFTGVNLNVHSIFLTIQGEGPFTGQPAIFIRLAGCNLTCPQCDTDYTSSRYQTGIEFVLQSVDEINHYGKTKLVVITGGEPFRQNVYPLIRTLLDIGYTVQIETNGTLPISKNLENYCSIHADLINRCFIVCSPKTDKINKKLQPFICAYKYVLSHDNIYKDGLPIKVLGHKVKTKVARPPTEFAGKIYVQPCDSKNESVNKLNLQACIDSALVHNYILQLQVHKLIGLE